ncbi:hypothetical protein HMPREF0291_11356 [Corynebacterium genitalium ATCC 33030]|uniref:Uncharacterized protein n=1 Tax=Corynebacterium genitalium ATCC 33030 TaxID=585529 RepID=D7WF18_9CORY|nr:hypothetical protein HMPREF0291_11356 [Corynebacterium genitalium ATCC 33030]
MHTGVEEFTHGYDCHGNVSLGVNRVRLLVCCAGFARTLATSHTHALKNFHRAGNRPCAHVRGTVAGNSTCVAQGP